MEIKCFIIIQDNKLKIYLTSNYRYMDDIIISDLSYFSKKKYNKWNEKDKLYSQSDYRFYKKRIFQLVKDIMQNRCNDETIVHSYHLFVKDAIQYLKFNDKSSVLQEEYTDLIREERNEENNVYNIEKNDDTNVNITTDSSNTIYTDSSINKQQSQKERTDDKTMNLLFSKDTIKKTGLTNIEKTGIVKRIKREKKRVQLPELKQVNLRDTKFKYKGIPKKKTNTQNKDTNTQDKKKQEHKDINTTVEKDIRKKK